MTSSDTDSPLDHPIATWVISLLIAFSVITFSIETLPNLTTQEKELLKYCEWLIMGLFCAEYIARILLTRKKLSYIFSFYGIIDFLAFVPFFIATSIDLRTLRILRFLRLFRVLKLARYRDALNRLVKCLSTVKEELVVYTLGSCMLIYLSAVGIYHFEHGAQPEIFKSVFDGIWWAVSTLTTVGYGDIHPITVGGKIFTFLILILGLGMIAVPTGIIASSLSSLRKPPSKNEPE